MGRNTRNSGNGTISSLRGCHPESVLSWNYGMFVFSIRNSVLDPKTAVLSSFDSKTAVLASTLTFLPETPLLQGRK